MGNTKQKKSIYKCNEEKGESVKKNPYMERTKAKSTS